MAHSQIILSTYLSEFYEPRYFIPDELMYHLSQLKFDGENGVSITRHLSDLCEFGECYKIENEGFICFLFFLTLEGRAKKWCHTLPEASIHLFEQLTSEFNKIFTGTNFKMY